jgi:N-formylglutamate amidohydrolase
MNSSVSTGFIMHNGQNPSVPLLVSVPHAGREYPESLFDNLRLPPDALLRLEDRYADLLARAVIAAGVPVIIAHRARAWIDLNRDARDIDLDMVGGWEPHETFSPSAKQRGGLGLIPRRLSGSGDIWRDRFSADDINLRLSGFYHPYHEAVADTLAAMQAKFGVAVLLDLHSMPPIHPGFAETSPQWVIGDLFGRSASAVYSEVVMAYIRQSGYSAALNHPYSGDHMLRKHADMRRNIHALQIEVDRSVYLDDVLREPGPGLSQAEHIVGQITHMLIDQAHGSQTLLAAE